LCKINCQFFIVHIFFKRVRLQAQLEGLHVHEEYFKRKETVRPDYNDTKSGTIGKEALAS
jgi:hypothetical protein